MLLLGITILVILTFSYRQYSRYFGTDSVVVAKVDLNAGVPVAASQLGLMQLPRDQVLPAAVTSPQLIIGKAPTTGVKAGSVVTQFDFAPLRLDLKQFIPEGRVLYSLNVSNKTLPVSGISRGDSVDIIVAGLSSEDKQRIANVLVRDARMVAVSAARNVEPPQESKKSAFGVDLSPVPDENEKTPESTLMLAVLPEDVVPLAEADGSGLHLAVVLHGDSESAEDRLRVKNRKRVQVIQGKDSKLVALPE